MDYTAWSKRQLRQKLIQDGKHTASLWCSSANGKPLVLLVHGISGDHAGLIPLAAELIKTHQVALIDLPGHGQSSELPLPNAAALQRWFQCILVLLEQEIGDVALICAHSFGCSAVINKKTLASHKVILLNPVPTPSAMYAHYSRIIMDSAHFWAHIYNWRLFILLRGLTLAKLRSRDVVRRIRWVGWNSRPTYRQIVFQAGLVDMILDGSAYADAKRGGAVLVVCGMFDTTACERDSLDMESVFGSTRTVFLRGGHLLPIESPQRVARLICETKVV
jgi:pimeloyl-ACP methyl ester carboxylesterase